MMLYHMIWQQ